MEDTTYSSRTRQNVVDSDATLIISPDKLTGGTLLSWQVAIDFNKPVFTVKEETVSRDIVNWLIESNIKILNIAGPRASEWSIGYKISFDTITNIINEIKNRSQNTG
jgi:hypothetical protein